MKYAPPLIPLFSLVVLAVCSASEIAVGNFSTGDLAGWTEKVFNHRTDYSIETVEGRSVLRAHSRHAASGLLKKTALNPKTFPVLRWSWKVEHTLKGEDVRRKSGDDFAARVYVVFPRTFFWQTRAINYVWAARMPKDSFAPSPYTSNAMVVAAESGDEKGGRWVSEERNIIEDYRRLFGAEPQKIGAVAVMTDTDDTGDEVSAWYGNISLASH